MKCMAVYVRLPNASGQVMRMHPLVAYMSPELLCPASDRQTCGRRSAATWKMQCSITPVQPEQQDVCFGKCGMHCSRLADRRPLATLHLLTRGAALQQMPRPLQRSCW